MEIKSNHGSMLGEKPKHQEHGKRQP